MHMKDGDMELLYFAEDKRNVKQVAIWHGVFVMNTFSDEESEKILEYAKFFG